MSRLITSSCTVADERRREGVAEVEVQGGDCGHRCAKKDISSSQLRRVMTDREVVNVIVHLAEEQCIRQFLQAICKLKCTIMLLQVVAS